MSDLQFYFIISGLIFLSLILWFFYSIVKTLYSFVAWVPIWLWGILINNMIIHCHPTFIFDMDFTWLQYHACDVLHRLIVRLAELQLDMSFLEILCNKTVVS